MLRNKTRPDIFNLGPWKSALPCVDEKPNYQVHKSKTHRSRMVSHGTPQSSEGNKVLRGNACVPPSERSPLQTPLKVTYQEGREFSANVRRKAALAHASSTQEFLKRMQEPPPPHPPPLQPPQESVAKQEPQNCDDLLLTDVDDIDYLHAQTQEFQNIIDGVSTDSIMDDGVGSSVSSSRKESQSELSSPFGGGSVDVDASPDAQSPLSVASFSTNSGVYPSQQVINEPQMSNAMHFATPQQTFYNIVGPNCVTCVGQGAVSVPGCHVPPTFVVVMPRGGGGQQAFQLTSSNIGSLTPTCQSVESPYSSSASRASSPGTATTKTVHQMQGITSQNAVFKCPVSTVTSTVPIRPNAKTQRGSVVAASSTTPTVTNTRPRARTTPARPSTTAPPPASPRPVQFIQPDYGAPLMETDVLELESIIAHHNIHKSDLCLLRVLELRQFTPSEPPRRGLATALLHVMRQTYPMQARFVRCLDACDESGMNAVILCSRNGWAEVLRLLLCFSLDLHKQATVTIQAPLCVTGTAVLFAIYEGHTIVVRILVEKAEGKFGEKQHVQRLLNSTMRVGNTDFNSLQLSVHRFNASQAHVELVKFLLRKQIPFSALGLAALSPFAGVLLQLFLEELETTEPQQPARIWDMPPGQRISDALRQPMYQGHDGSMVSLAQLVEANNSLTPRELKDFFLQKIYNLQQ